MKDIKLSELSEIWLKYKERKIKKTSLIQYQRIVNKYINLYLGEYYVSNLEITNVLDFIDCIGQNISRKSLQDIVVVLKSILYYGKIMGYSIFALNAIPSVKVTKKKIIILDWEDLNNLETFICHNMSYKNIGLLICLYTGIRLGEICALKWEDILLHDEKIIINKSVQRINEKGKSYTEIGIPKTENSIREIPINQSLYQYLILFQKAHGYILTGTEHYLDPRTYQILF